MTTVVVTGASGYLGTHCVAELLRQGFQVRATIRSAKNEAVVRNALQKASVPNAADALTFHVANLNEDTGWSTIMADSDFVLHVASPVPSAAFPEYGDLVATAVGGTKRVLKFAAESKSVRRVVHTSLSAAVTSPGYERAVFTEGDFSSTAHMLDAYMQSKTEAEVAAWDFVRSKENREQPQPLELVVVNPVGIFGPIYDTSRVPSSITIVEFLAKGKLKWVCPDIAFGIVDVRDVAQIQIKALRTPEAKNQRFILCDSEKVYSIVDIGNMMKPHLTAAQAAKLPRKLSLNMLVKALAMVAPPLKKSVPLLGVRPVCSSNKAQDLFDWTPIPAAEAVAESTKDYVKSGKI